MIPTDQVLEIAIGMAKEAGQILRERWGTKFDVQKKGEIDLVTEVDRLAEEMILKRIRQSFPGHAVLAEESGETRAHSEEEHPYLWLVDPLDGTTNFAHGYPCFCTSIALAERGEIQVGVVYDPIRNELFTAQKDKGAFLNGKPITISGTEKLDNSLLVTGFPYDVRKKKTNLREFESFTLKAQGVRRDGAAALDLAYVACGRFDGFWEFSLNPWDLGAGVLLIEEAGGKVTALDGSPFDLFDRNVIASNGRIHSQMIQILERR